MLRRSARLAGSAVLAPPASPARKRGSRTALLHVAAAAAPPDGSSKRPRRAVPPPPPPPALTSPAKRERPDLCTVAGRSYEQRWWDKGHARVAGVDEAGRGPLAGPVVAAAVVCPGDVCFAGVDDSKRLTEEEREALYEKITSHPRVEWAVSVQDREVIDSINILQATLRAMEGAVAGLPKPPDRTLIDGNRMPPACAHNAELLVGGDSKSFAIAAASIVAKVTRDRMMLALDAEYPQYGFGQHKGYGVPAHMEAIARHGPCPAHRRSFQPVKGMLAGER